MNRRLRWILLGAALVLVLTACAAGVNEAVDEILAQFPPK